MSEPTDGPMPSSVPQSRQRPVAGPKKDPKRLVRASYECLKQILDLDTQSTISDMNMLESINNSATLRYREIEEYVSQLVSQSKTVKQGDEGIQRASGKLRQVESRVANLETLVDQLDEWSSELEVKSRKYKKNT